MNITSFLSVGWITQLSERWLEKMATCVWPGFESRVEYFGWPNFSFTITTVFCSILLSIILMYQSCITFAIHFVQVWSFKQISLLYNLSSCTGLENCYLLFQTKYPLNITYFGTEDNLLPSETGLHYRFRFCTTIVV